jgi:hypothetical protein
VPAAAVFQHTVAPALADPFPVTIAVALPLPLPVGVGVGVDLSLGGRPERRSQFFLYRRSERDRHGRPVPVGVALGIGITFAIGLRCSLVRCSLVRCSLVRCSVIIVRDFIVGPGHGVRLTRCLPRDEPDSEREH